MSNNFYQPKNEFGKALVAVSTPKTVAGAATTDYIDISWFDTQDNLVFAANEKKLVSTEALKALQEQIHGQIQFKFIKVTEENPLPTTMTEANIDDLRTSIYIEEIDGTNKDEDINKYAEYVCTNTAKFESDEKTPSVTPEFERFGIGVANATASVSGAVRLSDTADATKDASQSVAATPKAVAAAQAAAEAKAEQVASDLSDLEEELKASIDKLEKTVAGFDGLQSDVDDLKETVGELEGDVGTLKTDVATAQTDITELKSDVSNLKEKVEGIEDAAEGVAAVGTLSLSVDTTGTVTADFPLESSLVRFELIENGAVTTLYPGVTYGTAGEKKQPLTLNLWAADTYNKPKTVKAHYVTTKAKAALFAEQDADPEEEEEEQGGAGDGQDEDEANKQD